MRRHWLTPRKPTRQTADSRFPQDFLSQTARSQGCSRASLRAGCSCILVESRASAISFRMPQSRLPTQTRFSKLNTPFPPWLQTFRLKRVLFGAYFGNIVCPLNASVAHPASNSGCRPNCRCSAQSETSAAYDILSAFASQQPHHAQQDWRLFPIQARQQQNQKRHPFKHHPHWTRIQAVKNGHAMCAPFIQYTGAVFACPLFSFFGGY